MHKGEYEDRGFPFRDFLLKLILILLCVFLILWFVPRFISMNKNKCNNKCVNEKDNKAITTNLKKMKNAGLNYFAEDNVPKNNGDVITITLKDMINKKLVSIKNSKNVKYNLNKSYIKLSKIDEEYLMKVLLKTKKKEKQVVLHLNNYSYCDNYLCERDDSKEEQNDSGNDVVDNSNTNAGSIRTYVVKDSAKSKTKRSKHYKYKYVKYIKSRFTNWSKWSNWYIVDCSTKRVSCSDDSISCLKKIQRYDKKVQTGTQIKKYYYDRTVLRHTANTTKSVCSSGNYILLNNKLYKTSTNYSFSLIERNKYMSITPTDSLYYRYEFISKNHYNVYKYNGTINEIINNKCDKPIIVNVSVYNYVNTKDIDIVKEPIYKTTCYASFKTRKLINKGKVLVKWSKYNNQNLLKNGWLLTKTKKRI